MTLDPVLDSYVTWAEIDLDAIAANVRALRLQVGPAVQLIAVVKANAYGHGACQVARAALQAGAALVAVHRAIEGVELRRSGIRAPVLVMGYTPPAAADLIVDWGLTPSLITREFAQALSARAGAAGTRVPVHLKVDTGMSRYGLLPSEVVDFARCLEQLPGLRLEGLFTHFATADSIVQAHALTQLNEFRQVVDALRAAGIEIPIIHAANSAATLRLPRAHWNAVRPGIALYGLEPSGEWASPVPLAPALALKSRVSRVRMLPAGAAVSYGRTFVAQRPLRVALVPVGYGDGYHRILSNRAAVLVHGQRAPILGRICMDQCVVDVTEIDDVQQGDEVVLIGRQGEGQIRAEEVAGLAGTINYEVTTSLLPRVTRVYLQDGAIVEVNSLEREYLDRRGDQK